MEMQLLLQKEANSAEYYQMLLSQNENQNILIHDIKKHLQSIDLLNDKKEHDKISAIYGMEQPTLLQTAILLPCLATCWTMPWKPPATFPKLLLK